MKILYLTYDGLNDPLGQSQILPYLEGLADKGNEITVISFEKTMELKAQSSKLKVIPLRYHKSPPILSTVYDIYRLRKEVRKVLKSHEIDIIHCRSYITSLVGLWAKRKYGVKFIFDMRGFWADERVEGKLWNLSNPVFSWIYKYFKRKESKFITDSDAVISLTDNAKNEILSWEHTEIDDSKITVNPTCVDLELFNSGNILNREKDDLNKDLGIHKDDFVLLYLGSLGTWYMLDEMLDFFSELKAKRQETNGECKFLFVTKDQDVLNDAIQKKGIKKLEILIMSCERNDVPKYISLCNASIFFINPSFSKKASAATKMGEILAMGKPIITNYGWGDVKEIVDEETGILVDEFSDQGYSVAADKLLTTNYDPTNLRSVAEKYFSLEQGVNKYNNIYQQLSKSTFKTKK